MCGIVGICQFDDKNVQRETLLKMRETLKHRGPDDQGLFISSNQQVGLGHRRLSIVDLTAAGNQPMSNEDATVWITYNGEIYNYHSLRSQLQTLGHHFKSQTDTEVIVHAYEEFGPECLHKLNGMFAFAIYDQKKNQVFAARDRFGIKPFYYLLKESRTFAFASEIKALIHAPHFEKSLNHVAIGDFFKYHYIPTPKTIWSDIQKLPHGHYLTVDLTTKHIALHRYYSLEDRLADRQPATVDQVYQLLESSVTDQLLSSDVEVGIFLSGGLDSSTIAYLASTKQNRIKTFSIDFQPDRFSELKYAQDVSKKFKTEHFAETMADIQDCDIQNFADIYDEPLADNSCIATDTLSRLASKHVKVALSGDGGDEVFAGYTWYDQWLAQKPRMGIALITSFYKKIGLKNNVWNFERQYSDILANGFYLNELKSLLATDVYKNFIQGHDQILERFHQNKFKSVRALQYVDLNTFLVDDLLSKLDLGSMANSLEVRVPFLDHHLVEAVFSLDKKDFPAYATGKPLIKKLLSKTFSNEFINRPKRGFSAPFYHWPFLKSAAQEILNGQAIKLGILKFDYVQKTLTTHNKVRARRIWLLLVFEMWLRRWFER